MKTITTTINLYQFNELTEEAKVYAVEQMVTGLAFHESRPEDDLNFARKHLRLALGYMGYWYDVYGVRHQGY